MVAPLNHYKTKASEIWIDKEDIMHVVFAKGAELTVDAIEESFALYRELGLGPGGKKIRQLLSGGPVTAGKEARDLTARYGVHYFTAAAMVTNSRLMRLVVNSFNAIQKPGVPFKLFPTEEEALSWLRTVR